MLASALVICLPQELTNCNGPTYADAVDHRHDATDTSSGKAVLDNVFTAYDCSSVCRSSFCCVISNDFQYPKVKAYQLHMCLGR